MRDFGDLTCGCNDRYGGPRCDVGCPGEQLFKGNYDEQERTGWWMCGKTTASGTIPGQRPAFLDSDESPTWVVKGSIPIAARERTLLKQSPSCNCVDGQACSCGFVFR